MDKKIGPFSLYAVMILEKEHVIASGSYLGMYETNLRRVHMHAKYCREQK